MDKLTDLELLDLWKGNLKQLKEEKEKYIEEEYHGIKDDLVEWEEKDDTCIGFNENIAELEDKISKMEDYLMEHGE